MKLTTLHEIKTLYFLIRRTIREGSRLEHQNQSIFPLIVGYIVCRSPTRHAYISKHEFLYIRVGTHDVFISLYSWKPLPELFMCCLVSGNWKFGIDGHRRYSHIAVLKCVSPDVSDQFARHWFDLRRGLKCRRRRSGHRIKLIEPNNIRRNAVVYVYRNICDALLRPPWLMSYYFMTHCPYSPYESYCNIIAPQTITNENISKYRRTR